MYDEETEAMSLTTKDGRVPASSFRASRGPFSWDHTCPEQSDLLVLLEVTKKHTGTNLLKCSVF